jgi:carbon storage regulator CsrA
MLVLARKADEVIRIGDDIRITVVAVRRGVVRLGIEAPPETLILREELRRNAEERSSEPVDNREGKP